MKKKDKNSIASKARKAGLEPRVVYARMNKGWSLKKALSTPVRETKRHAKVKDKEPTVAKSVTTHKRVAPKLNKPVVEHYKSDRGLNKAVLFSLGIIIALLMVLILGG